METFYDQLTFLAFLALVALLYLWDVRATVRRRHEALREQRRTPRRSPPGRSRRPPRAAHSPAHVLDDG